MHYRLVDADTAGAHLAESSAVASLRKPMVLLGAIVTSCGSLRGRLRSDLEILVFGELTVTLNGAPVPLPASRKTRALLGYLVATERPHRRERLCELLWGLPDDPKAALRWSLSKLRKVVDAPDAPRIIAGRERVEFDSRDVRVDSREIHARLRDPDVPLAVSELIDYAARLDQVFLDGLDGVGDESFDAWLTAEREDARGARIFVLRQLAMHPHLSAPSARKWFNAWEQLDPDGAAAYQAANPGFLSSASDEVRSSPITDAAAPIPESSQNRPEMNAISRALRSQRIGFCEAADGAKIAYATIGTGPPLVKAANWLNHLEFDWNSPIWGRSFGAIASRRTFIRYDERGCGLSDWEVKDLSFEAFVDDLEAVVDKLGLERFPLLGISQGCAVSIEYAVRHPERVSGLILVSGYAAGWKISASPEEQARREAVRALTELGWGTDNPAYRHIFSQTFMPEASSEELAWFDDFQRQTTSPSNAARFQDAFGDIDVRHRLALVSVPTIVLHSKYDQRIPLEQGRALASGIPGAQFVPLESRNHILLDSEPAWGVCADAVTRFMREMGI